MFNYYTNRQVASFDSQASYHGVQGAVADAGVGMEKFFQLPMPLNFQTQIASFLIEIPDAGGAPPPFVAVFRRTLSAMGLKVGSRQVHGWS